MRQSAVASVLRESMSERIQKYLARIGYGSRRQIESWLSSNDIVDGDRNPYRVGQKVGPDDRIFLFGTEIVVDGPASRRPRVLAYHKRLGEVSTASDPQGRPTIYDNLPPCGRQGKWVSAGRLDINSSGLILFSDDGELIHSLTHPSGEVVREYRCRVWGQVGADKIKRLKAGVRSRSDLLRFDEVKLLDSSGGANSWYRVVIRRGKNREVRRAWEAVGCKVNRLIRTRFASVRLRDDHAEGSWLELKRTEVETLLKIVGK